jgi:glycolate oxidase FAD binding subunit
LNQAFGRDCAEMDRVTARRLTGQAKPVVRFAPESEAELAELLKLAHAERWTVSPMGNGTQAGAGNVPRTIDLVVCTHRLNRILEYSPADLVVTVQPGMLWREFQAALAAEGQMLPVDPVCSPSATVGGIVATAASGPLRALYGTLRDMTIGLRVVYPDGCVVKTGGKVVKNVAGYDMTKLFVGSYGTLGVFSEITFKLRPLPAFRELCLLSGDQEATGRLALQLIHSSLVPSRAEALSGPYANLPGSWTLAVECHENEAACADQTRRLMEWAAELGLATAVLRGDEVDQFWQAYQETLASLTVAVRFTAPPSAILKLGEELRQRCGERGLTAYVSIGSTTGVGRLYLGGGTLADQCALVEWLRERVEPSRGSAVLEQAPLGLRKALDSFGAARPDLRLMRGIKASIDPLGLLNPGRFVGGI